MRLPFSATERRFRPTWPLTLLTVLLLAAFVSLGRWQWERGDSKQEVWAQFQRDLPAVPVSARELDRAARFTHVSIEGRFDPQHQFVLDNRSHAGRPGYQVLTPFILAGGGRVLVNRGWIPFTGYRDRLPDVSLGDTPTRRISGRIDDLPAAGLASGRAPPAADATWPKLTTFPTHEELQAALGATLERRVLLLDPDQRDGYLREWSPPGLAPDRHYSYAIQWWGFATVLLVLYFGLNFRKVS